MNLKGKFGYFQDFTIKKVTKHFFGVWGGGGALTDVCCGGWSGWVGFAHVCTVRTNGSCLKFLGKCRRQFDHFKRMKVNKHPFCRMAGFGVMTTLASIRGFSDRSITQGIESLM